MSRKRAQPDDPPVAFFTDECIGDMTIRLLRAAGLNITSHGTLFQPGEPDHLWVPRVTTLGLVILTRDKHMNTRPLEAQAILDSGARQFVVRGHELSGEEIARRVLSHRKKVTKISNQENGPFIYWIQKHKVELKYRKNKLKKLIGYAAG